MRGPVAQSGRGARLRNGLLQVRILLGPFGLSVVRCQLFVVGGGDCFFTLTTDNGPLTTNKHVAIAQLDEHGPPKAAAEGSNPSRNMK